MFERVVPECNPDTLKDGRGGIFTYYPDTPIVEWNLLFTRAGEARGFHWHPEFDEYVLIVDGHGAYLEPGEGGADEPTLVSTGDCLQFPSGKVHTLIAISDMRSVALLTKRWDDCERPLVRWEPEA